MSITPKAIQDLLDELEASKQSRLRAWNVLAAASLGSFRGGEHCDSGTGSEDIRRGRRDTGTCFDKILPDSKRGDQKFVLLRSSLPGRDHQGKRMAAYLHDYHLRAK